MQDGSYTFVIAFQDSAENKDMSAKRHNKSIRVGKEYWETGILILFVVRFRFLKKSGKYLKKCL